MNTKRFFGWLSFIIVIILIVWGLIAASNKASRQDASLPIPNEISSNDWVRGNKDSNVILVEYSDFQCPACAAYEPLVRQVVAEHPNDVRFVFRNFPLIQIHPNALLAAKYAEAAGIQGKFWEMHDALYDQQNKWANSLNARELIESYAKEIGLDVVKLATDAQAKSVEDKILAQYKEGTRLGVQGTPTFFINGKKIESNPSDAKAFGALIEEAKAK